MVNSPWSSELLVRALRGRVLVDGAVTDGFTGLDVRPALPEQWVDDIDLSLMEELDTGLVRRATRTGSVTSPSSPPAAQPGASRPRGTASGSSTSGPAVGTAGTSRPRAST